MKFIAIRVGYLNLTKEIRDLKRSGCYQFEPRFSEMVKLEIKSWKLFKVMNPSLEDMNSKLHEIWEIYGEFECHTHSKFDGFVKQMKNRISQLNRLIFEKNSHVMNSGNSIARRELNTLKPNKNQIQLGGN